jgi:lysophospholipase L1-like esterase
VSAWELNAHKPGEAARVVTVCSDPYPPKEVYAFYLRNLDHMIASFRNQNPAVKIVISTLVGRWPMDTEEQFERDDGHIWWMKGYHMSRQGAAAMLARFNQLIVDYAGANHLTLVDMAGTFAGLDRQRLMWSFAHMTNEGYEIVARTFYDAIASEQRTSAGR